MGQKLWETLVCLILRLACKLNYYANVPVCRTSKVSKVSKRKFV